VTFPRPLTLSVGSPCIARQGDALGGLHLHFVFTLRATGGSFTLPKIKSHSGAKKRFEFTGRGRLARAKAYKGHLNQHKSPSRKRRHAGKALVAKGDLKLVRKLLPNLKGRV